MNCSAESAEHVENPYASPRCVETQDDAETLLNATTKLYRRMGWSGMAYTAIVYLIVMIVALSERPSQIVPMIAMTTTGGLMIAFFVMMIRTAKDLAIDVNRTYRRARWMAVLAAAIFFPILTVPAFLAVRRLERYRGFLVAQTHE